MNKKLISILFTVLFLLSFTTSVSAQKNILAMAAMQ